MNDWRNIDTAPKGKHVLVHYKNGLGKSRIAHAVYIERFTEESIEDHAEYSEEKDEYYTPEGWYEICQNWDDYSAMKIHDGEPDSWQPLPEPPTRIPKPQSELPQPEDLRGLFTQPHARG